MLSVFEITAVSRRNTERRARAVCPRSAGSVLSRYRRALRMPFPYAQKLCFRQRYVRTEPELFCMGGSYMLDILEISDLSLHLTQTGRPLLEHFSFTLGAGDRAVLIGEEGNGKSTLLRYLAQPEALEG